VKEEHYRRIAWANERFGEPGKAGWMTERGRTYIQFGPPSETETWRSGGYERWFYRSIRGVGENVSFEFGRPRAAADPDLVRAEEQLRLLRQQYRDTHPEVLKLEEVIDELRRHINQRERVPRQP
jgi:hypothetical protein